jgi:hypothetical protein
MTLKELSNRREFGLKHVMHNLNKTTHALDKLYIRMMAFYGIPMKHLQEKTGFICLKLEKISNVFIPYFSYSNFVLF